MMKRLLNPVLNKTEKDLGVQIDYLRRILDVSTRLFFRFTKMFSVAGCRKTCPKEAFHVANITATLTQDCGDCVQMAINVAKKDGLSAEVVEAVIHNRADDLPDDLRPAYELARQVAGERIDAPDSRRAIVERYGEEALIELAFTIGTSQFFPIVKRAMGYASVCDLRAMRV